MRPQGGVHPEGSPLGEVWQRFAATVCSLAEGTAPLPQRLAAAYGSQLLPLDPAALPPDLQAEFAALQGQLVRGHPGGGAGGVAATASALSDPEAQHVAARLFWLYDQIARRYGRQEWPGAAR